MKKRLLSFVFAALCAVGVSAYNVGEYAYTSTQRFKIDGENLLANGNFSQNFDGWTDAEGATVSAENWSLEAGVGPNGETVLKSLGGTQEGTLCYKQSVAPGLYIISFSLKGEGTANVTNSTIFVNNDGALTKGTNSTETPVVDVLSQATYAEEWRENVAVINVSDTIATPFVIINFGQLPTDAMVANFALHPVSEVYDVRIMQNRFNFAKEVMAMPEFNTNKAAEAREILTATIEGLEGAIAAGEMDDPSAAEDILTSFEDQLEYFLSAESDNMAVSINTLDFASLAGVGRGRNFPSGTMTNIILGGGNWGHNAGEDCLMSAIQTGQKGHTATFTISNSNFPAGKYFFSAEIRNAYTTKSAWPCPGQVFSLETTCKMSLGQDTIDAGPISGEAYQRFNMIADVKEDGKFTASIYWPGTTNGEDIASNDGGAFYIRKVCLRGFGDMLAKAERMQAWLSFKAQYDAMMNARNKLYDMIGNGNYPWAQDSLIRAKEQWDAYYNDFMAKGWLNAEGGDAGVATIDELTDWATTTGIVMEAPFDKYAMVRGYQYATNFVEAQNQVITDLAIAIDEAKKTRNKGTNATGDRATFKTAIETALNTLITVRDNTTDATRVADSITLADTKVALELAVEAFLASAEVKPIVDIDFSSPAELVSTDEAEYYVIKGAASEMTFSVFQPDNTVADYSFAQGFNGELNDRLHVGGDSYGEVLLSELGDNDVLKIYFDFWFGQLGKAFQGIDLVNAAGNRVAGFSYDCYNQNISYNDFDNAEGQGMVIKGNVNSNHDKSGGAATVAADNLVNKFELTLDYKNQTIQGTLKNPKANKTIEGVAIPMSTAEDADNKVVAFRVVGQGHAKANGSAFGRRAWFDNLQIYRYADAPADFEEDILQSPWSDKTGIQTVGVEKKNNAIYSIMGVRLKSIPQKGMYIMNGKKYIAK